MEKSKKREKHVHYRHNAWFGFLRFIAGPIFKIRANFKPTRYKIKKGHNALILSNHQANLDPVYVALCFNKPIYFVASEHIFHKGWISKVMNHVLAPIPKKKGDLDINCIQEMMKVAQEGGNIAVFLEGNRTWTNSQFTAIGKGIVKLVRKLNINLILFNLKGGFGVNPRFGKKLRRGPFTGVVRYDLTPEKIKEMSDEDLFELIIQALDVKDASQGELYKSKERAEYLERMMFVCPHCLAKHTLWSEGNIVKCSSCGAEIEYTENLKLDYKFDNTSHELLEYYKFQLKQVRDDVIQENKVIFSDENVIMYDQTSGKRIEIGSGTMSITDKYVKVGNFELSFDELHSCSVISGTMVTFNTKDKAYIAIGHERFNPLKYVFYIDKITSSGTKSSKADNYYGINLFEI